MKFSPAFVQAVAQSKFVQQIKDGVLTVDNSEYVTWDACFTQGLYYGGLKRVGARSRSPLAFGGAVHAGLDKFLSLYGQDDFIKVKDACINAAMADAAVTELDMLGDPKRNTSKLEDLLLSYTLEYSRTPSMRFNILKVDGKPCVEQSFTVPLGVVKVKTTTWGDISLEVIWSGKIDVLEKYEGALTPDDHKTTTVMGEKFVDDKIRSSQFLGYTYAAFGARINALAMRSTGFEFKIFDIPYPDWKVAEWQAETLESIRLLVQELDLFLSTGTAVPTREHCVTKYGKCQYFDVCDSPEKMRDRIIFDDSYYFISDWSPLAE
jgi:hypothetical protein